MLKDGVRVDQMSFPRMITLHLTQEELYAAHSLAARQRVQGLDVAFAAVDGPLWLFSAQWARNMRMNAHGENWGYQPQSPPTLAKEETPVKRMRSPCPGDPFPLSLRTRCAAVFWDVYPHGL